MSASSSVSVLVPVGSDAEELVELHRERTAELEKLGLDYEVIYLVASHNRPGVERVARLLEGAPAHTRALRFAGTADEAAMLQAGAERARHELLLTLPDRVETELSAIRHLCEAIEAGADVAIAQRKQGSRGRAASLQSRAFNRLLSWATGRPFGDIASATRAIRAEVLREIPLYGDFHRYLPFLAERVGFRVHEIQVEQDARASRPRVHRPLIYLWRGIDVLAVFFIARFTRHPLRLFGGVGAAFLTVGAGMMLVLGVQRLAGTPLGDRPILVLATLLVGVGVQALAIGLLAELILFFHARRVRDYRVSALYPPSERAAPAEPSEGS